MSEFPSKKIMHVLLIALTTVMSLLILDNVPIVQYILIGWILGYATGVICEHEPEGEDQ
jgi:hypothetical protein